jgi:hypothetical protein
MEAMIFKMFCGLLIAKILRAIEIVSCHLFLDYSRTLFAVFYLPPLRFHCVEGIEPRTVATIGMAVICSDDCFFVSVIFQLFFNT